MMLWLVAVLSLTLAGCKKDDAKPVATLSQLLATGVWRLDSIEANGRTTSSGTGIKDRYTLTFRPDGTYTQDQFVNGDTYNGTWMLMNNNTLLHFTDHKGDDHEYTLMNLTESELRYRWTNKDNELEDFVFSAQP
ncbi:lipocalin family protein [Hymenobacter psychrotolerans]|uniref:Lipocalin-like domain-containing protein n=1 Tax=Hymenobacter psychrotolerans DSM 18569 TaxID=1121959 RepID=A0A1M7B8D1_9BACT|nr:lipocalin family protein [Hymenobacter psychrotolerans]SHL51136.1 Lipocalin-like domain-containing protein [Hymenobacter psychrotolerans DSM 18569]